MIDLDLLTTLKICILLFLPMMFIVIWLLPKLINSKPCIKIGFCAGIISIFVFATIALVDNAPFVMSQKTITGAVTIFWGIIGWFIGGYYDLRLRVKLGANYYNEVLRFQINALKYIIVYVIIFVILGTVTGRIIIAFGFSIPGILIGITFGVIYGAILGMLLDVITKQNNSNVS